MRRYFPVIVDATEVAKGKPDPEIFITAAERLRLPPSRCVVFEDALHGIEATRRAGMKVVALATTHASRELSHADAVVKDFTRVVLAMVRKLVDLK